jgi:Carboxypeptidase regulatory-like domain
MAPTEVRSQRSAHPGGPFVRWVRSTLALSSCTLVALASSAPETNKARFAVVSVGQCSAPSTAISTRAFRALLVPKLGAGLQTEADTARPLGGLAERTLEEVERGVAAARKDFYSRQVETAVTHLKTLAVDITRIAPSEERWKVERDLLTLLSQTQLASNTSAAEATMVTVLRVQPSYQADTGLYPPSFRKFVDAVRSKQAEVPTNRLDVAVAPTGRTVYVGGFPAGPAPLSHHFPAGDYRVEADYGHRSLVRTVHIPEPPAVVAPVELAASVEGSLFADGGPCVEPGSDRTGNLARVVALTGVSRLLALRSETSAGQRWVFVEEVDSAGNTLREARSKVQQSAPETDALAGLAAWAATGNTDQTVEVLKRYSAAPPLVARANARGRVSGSVLGQPAPTGFTLESFPVNGQISPGPRAHFSGSQFENVDQPSGRVSLRILTDDGRVGTADVEIPADAAVQVRVRVETACTATGRVMNGKGQPALGAHLVAQQLGSRISESTTTGPKGRFLFRELTQGDYQLTVAVGSAHVVRRFSVDKTCAADIGTLMLLDAPADGKAAK